ncbi:Sensor protein degS [Rothia kristinae]|nr:Sensor protein degS [Rothia kristinae]
MECSLRLEGREATQLPEPVQTALLRGAQASLANVTAHAGAARAVLTLTVSAEEALLDVYDDGVGFDPATLEDPRAAGGSDSGYGLPGLRRRLQTLGGSLTVDSAPEEGTVIGMRLPLTSATGDAVGSASTADDASEETASPRQPSMRRPGRPGGSPGRRHRRAEGDAGREARMMDGNETAHPVRVLLVDDHPVVRAGLRALLEGFAELSVAAEAADGAAALERAPSWRRPGSRPTSS